MVDKIPRTQEQLADDFANQIAMLKRRCDAYYEEGAQFEALSTATIVRVLLHDTRLSMSLLAQLRLKGTTRFLDSRSAGNLYVPGIANGYGGFQPRTRIPHKPYRETDLYAFAKWWEQQPFKVRGYNFTRKDLITKIANQEGGAHVDEEQDARIAALRGTDSRWRLIEGDETFPMRGEELASVCAIGEEVLFSLTPEPDNRKRMLIEEYQRPFYFTQEESDEAKAVLKNDLAELEKMKEGADALTLVGVQIARTSIEKVLQIETFTIEDYEVRNGIPIHLGLDKIPWD